MTNLTMSVIQRPQDLVLAILPDTSLPLMVVLQQAEHRLGDWSFQFSIIGESHHIRVERAGECVLNEVLACVSVVEADCFHYQPFRDLSPYGYQSRQYQVQVAFGKQPSWEIPAQDMNQLEYIFPRTHGQQPVTRIQWQSRENTVHWWTLHTYPAAEQTVFVHTTSVFLCDDEGSDL